MASAKGASVSGGYGNEASGLYAAFHALPACINSIAVSGQTVDDVVFRGCNVHVQNGSGSTNSSNGVGNLIIGYNEDDVLIDSDDDTYGANARGGSHNVVIGPEHSYSSYGGLVAGFANTVSGIYASVSGGRYNKASGVSAGVSGGVFNEASVIFASISGGRYNEASGSYASVSGGSYNEASGSGASVSGGYENEASAVYASVSGGRENDGQRPLCQRQRRLEKTRPAPFMPASAVAEKTTASALYASVSGGHERTASGEYDWRAGTLSEDN